MPESEAPAPRKRGFASQTLAWTIAVTALALAGLLVVNAQFSGNDAAAPLRTLQLDKGAGIDAPKVSPDGQSVVYVRDGRVVVRRLDEIEGREVGNATDAASPFWSMDGRFIGYFAQGPPIELRQVSVADGATRVLVSGSTVQGQAAFAPFGAADCGEGVMFIAWGQGLMRVTYGQAPTMFAPLDSAPTGPIHRACAMDGSWPSFWRETNSF